MCEDLSLTFLWHMGPVVREIRGSKCLFKRREVAGGLQLFLVEIHYEILNHKMHRNELEREIKLQRFHECLFNTLDCPWRVVDVCPINE